MLKKLVFLASLIYTFTLTFLSLASIKAPEGLPENKDKIFHALAYFLFTGLWFFTAQIKFKFSKIKALVFATIFSISFGVIMEFLQQQLTQNRQADFNDVLANTIGTVIAVVLILMFKKTPVKNY